MSSLYIYIYEIWIQSKYLSLFHISLPPFPDPDFCKQFLAVFIRWGGSELIPYHVHYIHMTIDILGLQRLHHKLHQLSSIHTPNSQIPTAFQKRKIFAKMLHHLWRNLLGWIWKDWQHYSTRILSTWLTIDSLSRFVLLRTSSPKSTKTMSSPLCLHQTRFSCSFISSKRNNKILFNVSKCSYFRFQFFNNHFVETLLRLNVIFIIPQSPSTG